LTECVVFAGLTCTVVHNQLIDRLTSDMKDYRIVNENWQCSSSSVSYAFNNYTREI